MPRPISRRSSISGSPPGAKPASPSISTRAANGSAIICARSAASGAAIVVGLDAEGAPAGFVTIDAKTGDLDQLCVAPSERGSGLARALLDEAKRRSPGAVELEVNEANARALRFYEREGFDRCLARLERALRAADAEDAVEGEGLRPARVKRIGA